MNEEMDVLNEYVMVTNVETGIEVNAEISYTLYINNNGDRVLRVTSQCVNNPYIFHIEAHCDGNPIDVEKYGDLMHDMRDHITNRIKLMSEEEIRGFNGEYLTENASKIGLKHIKPELWSV